MKWGQYIYVAQISGTPERPKQTIAAYIVCIADGGFVELMYMPSRHTSIPEKKVDVTRLARTLTERKSTHPKNFNHVCTLLHSGCSPSVGSARYEQNSHIFGNEIDSTGLRLRSGVSGFSPATEGRPKAKPAAFSGRLRIVTATIWKRHLRTPRYRVSVCVAGRYPVVPCTWYICLG